MHTRVSLSYERQYCYIIIHFSIHVFYNSLVFLSLDSVLIIGASLRSSFK